MRVDNWQSELVAAVRYARDRPFAWGSHDCAMFAGGCIAAITGADPFAVQRDIYSTEKGAARVIKRLPGGTLEAAADDLFGKQIGVNYAATGDLVLHDTPAGPAFGICVGVQFAGAGQSGGVVFGAMADALAAWRVI